MASVFNSHLLAELFTYLDLHSVYLFRLTWTYLVFTYLDLHGPAGPGAWRPQDVEAQMMPSFMTHVSSTPILSANASGASSIAEQQVSALKDCLALRCKK